MSGFVGDLSEKQSKALNELKSRLDGVDLPEPDDVNIDSYLLKWLRARQFNVEQAEHMLRNHLSFREKWNVQSLLDNWHPPEVLDKYMVGGLCGFDKGGSPVWYEPFGYFDPRGVVLSSTGNDLTKMKIQICEEILSQLRSQTKKLGKPIDRMVIVFDLEKAGLSHIWKPFIDRYNLILQIFEAHYPEMLKKCFVINAPAFFSIGFNLIKKFLSEATKNKVVVLGGNYQDVLKEAIGEDLPAHFGGTVCDPDGDPRCVSKIRFGGKVPESFYLKDNFMHEGRLTEVNIGHGSNLELTYEVKEEGHVLKWEFMTRHNNIGFGVFYQPSPDTKRAQWEEVVERTRCSCHLVPEIGGYSCEKLGTYIVQFDNSFSWMRGKKVLYLIEIQKEGDHES
ncbi:SEC14-like protein 2 [Strongylocentrotus purpuratus]|uniref:SEC14-like protein 2 n=1 Tax=Strongylocentrotus purpuratus TaxID=7668 RepID=A0A7M7RF67_STRPU|nr:SEC14-like protein 2 [Strongylocentrotus purpuratus]|eukprot:XP_797087.2 PREDICTED: SEC14-like protein 2 [Strongylocentrotus purpuratus]